MNQGTELKHIHETEYVTFWRLWRERCLRGRLSHTTKALNTKLSVLNLIVLAIEAIKGL